MFFGPADFGKSGAPMTVGLALASSQIANGYLVPPLATEQRVGIAKLATGVSRGA